jgi:hypothetical protein
MSVDKRGNVRSVSSNMMIEWYVDGVLSDTVFTTVGMATGGFAAVGGAVVTGVHRLSLPEATPYLKPR